MINCMSIKTWRHYTMNGSHKLGPVPDSSCSPSESALTCFLSEMLEAVVPQLQVCHQCVSAWDASSFMCSLLSPGVLGERQAVVVREAEARPPDPAALYLQRWRVMEEPQEERATAWVHPSEHCLLPARSQGHVRAQGARAHTHAWFCSQYADLLIKERRFRASDFINESSQRAWTEGNSSDPSSLRVFQAAGHMRVF